MIHFKKTLLATVFACTTLSAQAADISLYGSLSTGMVYKNTPSLSGAGINENSTNTFSMESGFWGDSIWGITGEEDLGNGWKVGFTLENEYLSDSGELANPGSLFDSQAYLRIGNDRVNLAFGNFGGLSSAGGDFDLLCGFDPMEAYVDVAGLGAFASKDFASANMISVEITPMEGFKLSLMGNLGDDDQTEPSWSDRNHYYGLGLSYEKNALALTAIAETRQYAAQNTDDGWTFTLAAAYDFGVVRPSVVYQHANKTQEFAGEALGATYNFDSFMVGATAPLGQGTLRASIQYVMGESETNSAEEGSATILGLAYTYDLSKRTSIYCAGFYALGADGLDSDLNSNDISFGAMNRADYNSRGFGVGLVHAF